MIYDEANIVSTYTDCDDCNTPCYKLIDCDGPENHPTVFTSNLAFEVYVGQAISWIDEADAPDFIERCAVVHEYVCRKESYPAPVITVIDCFKTCVECKYVAPDPIVPDPIIGRDVAPGYDVADCVTPPKCETCE